MTDDIVTQLRLQADVVNGKDYHTISGGLHLDAADEIERLRKLAHDLYEETKKCGTKHDVPATNNWEQYEDDNG